MKNFNLERDATVPLEPESKFKIDGTNKLEIYETFEPKLEKVNPSGAEITRHWQLAERAGETLD